MEAITDVLKNFRVLRGLSLSQLSAVANHSKELRAEKGALLFRENDPSDNMLFLLEGNLEVMGTSGHLVDIPPLSLVGEMGIVCKLPRSATVKAAGPVHYLSLERASFERLIDADREFGYLFFRNLSETLAERLKSNNLLVEFYQSMK